MYKLTNSKTNTPNTKKGVLAIDTASPVVGVAYYDALQQQTWQRRIVQGADSELLPVIEGMLQTYDIQSIVVSTGPGAFTGLRVGVSIALGLAFSKNISIIPMSSLFARSLLLCHSQVFVVLDARKNRVYAQLFDTSDSEPKMLCDAVDADLQDIIPSQKPFLAVGEGALVYRKQIEENGGMVVTDADISPVKYMAEYGYTHLELGMDPKNIQMGYVRGPSVTPPKRLGVAVGKEQDMDIKL